jgi:dynein light chain roadblock-type
LKRIQSHKGVVGIVVINNEGRLKVSVLDLQLLLLIFINPTGIPIKSTLDNATTVQYAGLVSQLADKARSVVRELDPTNDMTFFRLRSKKHEVFFVIFFKNGLVV